MVNLFIWSARLSEQQLREFNAQNLADTLWASAMVKQPYEKLFTGSSRPAGQRCSEFEARNLANTAWASALVNQS